MPNVDLDVCSIYELKHFEISSLYSDEISYYGITEEELIEMIGIFDIDQLLTNDINDSILLIITHLHG
jgi:Glu-tRNA(Gln) amidotransferase subunit E-like FAD-binding protein